MSTQADEKSMLIDYKQHEGFSQEIEKLTIQARELDSIQQKEIQDFEQTTDQQKKTSFGEQSKKSEEDDNFNSYSRQETDLNQLTNQNSPFHHQSDDSSTKNSGPNTPSHTLPIPFCLATPAPFEILNLVSTLGKTLNQMPAEPMFPKTITAIDKKPPGCPLKDIQFIQLERFKRFKQQQLSRMGEGFDLVGKKNMMRENREKRRKYEDDKKGDEEAKMDESTSIIQNIVYARDPKIFDTKSGQVNQRNAFGHLNLLDVKAFIRINQERMEQVGDRQGYRLMPPAKRFQKTRQQVEQEAEREQKSRYQLRKLEDGTVDKSDKTLLFESRFESGNLYLAQKVSDNEYNLLMQNDINTSGHTQWFFYQVKNTRKNNTVQFNILNFNKPDSLFNFGMKVTIYSQKKSEEGDGKESDEATKKSSVGWFKGGDRISYFQNTIRKDLTCTSRTFYTLTFSYTFSHDNDSVFFAYCYPYTYSDLQNEILAIETDPQRRAICSRKVMCKTIAGNDCEILTITEKSSFEEMQKKKAVVISSRVHPGETVGSWMMRGVIEFLTDVDNHEAKLLREKYIFKVIPMLNPDGVINGNYRCSLAGCDLNRRWKNPSKQLHPTIFHTKKLVKDLHQERGLLLYCDLHGHSRKQNVFMYGCNNQKKPQETRIFPLMLSKLSKFFDFNSCRFGVQKSKESTARISLYKELKDCPNIFTMESTFSGVDFGEYRGCHMTTNDMEQMGKDLCRTLLIYGNIHIPEELQSIFGSKAEASSMNSFFEKELLNNKKLIQAGEGDSSEGSDSEPSEDNLPLDEFAKIIPIIDKKQKEQLLRMQKKKADAEKEAAKQLNTKKRLNESPEPKSPTARQRSPTKPKEMIIQMKPVEEKKEKSKPEMKDAWTQTERSDLQRIKKQQAQKMLQEIKDQQSRLKATQANLPIKSTQPLTEAQPNRRSPQSQAGQRPDITSGALGVLPGGHIFQTVNRNKLGEAFEKNLEEMRDQNRYNRSKDKYAIMPIKTQEQIQQQILTSHSVSPTKYGNLQSPHQSIQIQ